MWTATDSPSRLGIVATRARFMGGRLGIAFTYFYSIAATRANAGWGDGSISAAVLRAWVNPAILAPYEGNARLFAREAPLMIAPGSARATRQSRRFTRLVHACDPGETVG